MVLLQSVKIITAYKGNNKGNVNFSINLENYSSIECLGKFSRSEAKSITFEEINNHNTGYISNSI